MFFEANESQNDDLLDCITSNIQWSKDDIIETKSVKVNANNKPWVSEKLKIILKNKKLAFIEKDALKAKELNKEFRC